LISRSCSTRRRKLRRRIGGTLGSVSSSITESASPGCVRGLVRQFRIRRDGPEWRDRIRHVSAPVPYPGILRHVSKRGERGHPCHHVRRRFYELAAAGPAPRQRGAGAHRRPLRHRERYPGSEPG
jgi:hypothetical protein